MEQIFFYDTPIYFAEGGALTVANAPYFKAFSRYIAISDPLSSQGNIGVKVGKQGFYEMLNNFNQIFTYKPCSIIIYWDAKVDMLEIMKDYFAIVHAAGGIVSKNGKALMIKRLGKWDLPKGKIESEEDTAQAAVREVLEECGVQAAINEKLCVTAHNYIQDGVHCLKQTTWYKMDCIDDQYMHPQSAEDITEVVWMSGKEVNQALENSYASIRYVWAAYENILLVHS